MSVRDTFKTYVENARQQEPVHDATSRPLVRRLRRLQSVATFALLGVNDALIDRFYSDTPEIWPNSQWPWIPKVEAATDAIRAELVAYDGATLPPVAALSGFDPDDPAGNEEVGVDGQWRSGVLYANGMWIDEVARHFPTTVSLFRDVRPKANLGFTTLDPHSHLAAHVGPNRGCLRFQLPLIVPGAPGDCRIRIGDEVLHWTEGEVLVFDLSTDHEVWNDTDEHRVLLMVELQLPMPQPLALVNRIAQYSYRWHPAFRGMTDRIAQFGIDHDRVAAERSAA